MTSASTTERPAHQHAHSSSRPSPRHKTTLFCPCGREAPADEWRTERHGDVERLVCPDCAATLTVR